MLFWIIKKPHKMAVCCSTQQTHIQFDTALHSWPTGIKYSRKTSKTSYAFMSITKVKLRYTQNIWFFVIFSEYNFKWVWWTCLVFMVLKAPFINLLIPSRWDVGHRMSSSWSKTTRTNKARRLKLHQEWVTSVGLWWWWKVLVYASFS